MSAPSIQSIPSPTPELSIIVPIVNEAELLPELFAWLAVQRGICFELIICDGGSNDNSLERVQELAPIAPFPVRTLQSQKGRGAQMNAGADIARCPLLLFLHADSSFADSDALAVAISFYRQNMTLATGAVAARFRLRFRRRSNRASGAYRYYEQKAELNRSDCIRGDQGFLISMDAFGQVGRFDTSLPFLEDIRMAASIAKLGNWLLIPADITTSARRFETEGLYERQALNAIITCCLALGWDDFFAELSSMYRTHGESGKIDLAGAMREIRRLIAEQPKQWRDAFWRQAGEYVAQNAWQLFFWLDVRQNFNTSQHGENSNRWLRRYERYAATFFHSKPAGFCAKILTWLWFHGECHRS